VLNNLIIFGCRKGVQVLVGVYVVVVVVSTMSNRIGSKVMGAEIVLSNDVRGGEPNRHVNERVR
jgi:hypothetical protein